MQQYLTTIVHVNGQSLLFVYMGYFAMVAEIPILQHNLNCWLYLYKKCSACRAAKQGLHVLFLCFLFQQMCINLPQTFLLLISAFR